MKKSNTKSLSIRTILGRSRRQAGVTLMEALVWFGIFAAVVVGVLSNLNSTNSSKDTVQLIKDITAVRSATQAFYNGAGGYGTASLDSTLITSNKIPSTLPISGGTISTSIGGTLTVTGNTTNFTMTLTNVPADICSQLLSNMSNGWASVKVGSSAAITTFPVPPSTATSNSNCGGSAPFSIVWTTTN